MKDLLISVTHFFRDPDAFARARAAGDPAAVRGQASRRSGPGLGAGCATGEEAYSVAMLLAEHADERDRARRASRSSPPISTRTRSPRRARASTPEADVADVAPRSGSSDSSIEEGAGYRVRRELREMVLFAHHNVIKDPPFSHLDLISCRNLLIYLNRDGAGADDRDVPFRAAARTATCSSARRSRPTAPAICSRRRSRTRASLPEPRRRREPPGAARRADRALPAPCRHPRLEPRPVERIRAGRRCTIACSSSSRRRRWSSPRTTRSCTCRRAAAEFLQIAGRRAVARPAEADPAGAARRAADGAAIRPRRDRAAVEVQRRRGRRWTASRRRQSDRPAGAARGRPGARLFPGPVRRERSTATMTQRTIRPLDTPEPIARQLEEELARVKTQLRTTIEQYRGAGRGSAGGRPKSCRR